VLALGGDHLTQDLSVGLRLPFLRAEQLKREHGDLFMNGHHADEKIVLERDMSSEERHLYRESMVKILHARQEEILRLVIEDIESHGLWNSLSGDVVITGGASQIRGLETMAREMFPLDVRMIREHEFFDGDLTCSTRPDLTAVFGLLNYARRKELASMQTKGWNRVRNAVGSLLSAMKLF
jgi:cell division protein FtsA